MRQHGVEGSTTFISAFSLIMIAGVVFSGVAALVGGRDAFAVGLIITFMCALVYSGAYYLLNLVRGGEAPNAAVRSDSMGSTANAAAVFPTASRSQRLRELGELRAGNLIDEAEYRKKREEILDDV
jgi:hypothetical protein